MYKRELDNLLSTKKIPKSLILFGESRYYIEHYSKIISDSISNEKFTIYFDDYEYQIAKNFLSQSSLFGDINMLIIKSDSKIKELKELMDICQKVNDSYLIFEYYGDDSRVYANYPNAVRFFAPNLNEATSILTQEASKLGINIDRGAIEHLITIQNFDISIAVNELKKLSIFDSKIGIKEVDSLSFALNDISLDDFIFKILSKEPFFDELNSILEREDEIKIVIAISNFINQLSLFYLSNKLTQNRDSRVVLGYKLPKHLEENRFNLALRLNSKIYKEIFYILQDTELRFKTESKIDKSAILYSTLIKIQTLL